MPTLVQSIRLRSRRAALAAMALSAVLAVLALAASAQAAQPADFGSANSFTVGESINPNGMAVADFNQDGRKDAVVSTGLGVSEVNGTGGGAFSAPVLTAFPGATNPTDVAEADFNGDAKRDVVRTDSYSNSIEVGLGEGNGTFDHIAAYDVGAGTAGVAVGDFDHSGNADVATADFNDGTVTILLNTNDRTGALRTYAPKGVGLGSNPDAIVAADFNDDGNLDLAVAERNIGQVAVLLGNGDGSFQNAVAYATSQPTTGIGGMNGLAAGDLNGDGKPDLVLGGQADSVSVFLNDGSGAFAAEQKYSTTTDHSAHWPVSVAIGDVNGDGVNDIVAGNSNYERAAAVLVGNGDGTFASVQLFRFGDYQTILGAAEIADLDGDGRQDLLFMDSQHSTVISLLNQTTHPPQALTGAASDLGADGATLNGTVNPYAQPTSYYFEYGTRSEYSASTPVGDGGAGGDAELVSAAVTGLQPSTIYHYRLVAHNAAGTTYGADRTFKTRRYDQYSTDLSIQSNDSPHTVVAGDVVTFQIAVHNGGPDDASGVNVTDALPAGTTFEPAGSSPGCSQDAGTVTCSVGSLASGASADTQIAVATSTIGTLDNTVAVTGLQSDPVASNDSATTHTTVEDPETAGCTILGTAGDDVIHGTAGADNICGLTGNDRIYGGDGNDTLRGEEGADRLIGEAGDDTLLGGKDADILNGGDGNDTFQGNGNNDYLKAVDGAGFTDQLSCGAGADTYAADPQDSVGGDCETMVAMHRPAP